MVLALLRMGNSALSSREVEKGGPDWALAPTFSSWLREMMELRGMDQVQVEAASGIDQTTISKYLKGTIKNPRETTIRKLAEALQVSPDRGLILTGHSTDAERAQQQITLPNGALYTPPPNTDIDIVESLLESAMAITRERKKESQ